ncbi:hypothetical protein FQN57_002235 [Myotisia sp. PD_48]|nr:hypothetical protein FQN57_002235 [Myotisia sp. PD_48]
MTTPVAKGNLGATPTHITSSPYPTAVPMGRPLSQMSHSMRTPSGSAHQPHASTSSQQYPTPLAAAAAAASLEDATAFSSPSAMLALGLSGVTPSSAGNEALAGQGMNLGMGMGVSDIQNMPIPTLSVGPKDIDEEKRRKVMEVIGLLRTRVAGRGVCREGVERLGKLEGFECMWQENNLSIAGNSVDLEIEFEPRSERVRDVTLRYATPEAQEGEKREEASAVLKRDLILQSLASDDGTRNADQEIFSGGRDGWGKRWKGLEGFHENLQRLAKLDQLCREVNCFEAVEGIHESLQRVLLAEESIYSPQTGFWEQLCSGAVGWPSMHSDNRVGLVIRYWAEQRQLLNSEQVMNTRSNDDEKGKGKENPRQKAISNPRARVWSVVIECEPGYPSLRISKQWIGMNVFVSLDSTSGEITNGYLGDNEIKVVNWIEPATTMVTQLANNNDMLGTEMLRPQPPGVRFVARLEPTVDVPIMVAAEIYRVLGIPITHEISEGSYDRLLMPVTGNKISKDTDDTTGDEEQQPWRKEVFTLDDGRPVKYRHACTFHAIEQVPGCRLRDLPFSHPRQIADMLPVLRQYAMISSLLRRFSPSGFELDVYSQYKIDRSNGLSGAQSESVNGKGQAKPQPNIINNDSLHAGSSFVSNKDAVAGRLDNLLHLRGSDPRKERRVNVSLRTAVSSAPSILVMFMMPRDAKEEEKEKTEDNMKWVGSIQVDVGENGTISIPAVGGRLAQGTGKDGETEGIREKLARVLETCEDLGLLVEWAIQWINHH